MLKAVTAVFSGQVQGVGFRYTVRHLAQNYAVKGYVRNLPGGQVELVAEGEEEVLREFLQSIQRSALADFIRDTREEWTAPAHVYSSFQIRM